MVNKEREGKGKDEKLYYYALLGRDATAKEIWEHASQLVRNWKEKEKKRNDNC